MELTKVVSEMISAVEGILVSGTTRIVTYIDGFETRWVVQVLKVTVQICTAFECRCAAREETDY